MSLWLIGAVYVKGMGSLWTIFFFIVRLPVPYGMPSSVDFGCLALCLDSSRPIYELVDCQKRSKCCCVEDGAFISLVLSMEGNE
jgi:hypothetical protein